MFTENRSFVLYISFSLSFLISKNTNTPKPNPSDAIFIIECITDSRIFNETSRFKHQHQHQHQHGGCNACSSVTHFCSASFSLRFSLSFFLCLQFLPLFFFYFSKKKNVLTKIFVVSIYQTSFHFLFFSEDIFLG